MQTCSRTNRKRIRFEELTNEYTVVGMCGQCLLIAEYLLQRNEISDSFLKSLQKDASSLPFGLYFCTSKGEYPALCILWNPNDSSAFESKALVLLRILCQLTSALWVFDNTNIETLRGVATKDTEVKLLTTVMKQGTRKLWAWHTVNGLCFLTFVDDFEELVGNAPFVLKGESKIDNNGYQVISNNTRFCLLSETLGVRVEDRTESKPLVSDCYSRCGDFTDIVRQLENYLVEFENSFTTLFATNLTQERLNLSPNLEKKLKGAEELLLSLCPTAEFMFRKQEALSLLTQRLSTALIDEPPDQSCDSQLYFCKTCDSISAESKCSPCDETGVRADERFVEEWDRLSKQKDKAKDMKPSDSLLQDLSECIAFLELLETATSKAADKLKASTMNSKEFGQAFFGFLEEPKPASGKPQHIRWLIKTAKSSWSSLKKITWFSAEERTDISHKSHPTALETYTTHRSHLLCKVVFRSDSDVAKLHFTSFDTNPGCTNFSLSGKVTITSQPFLMVHKRSSQLCCDAAANEVLFCFFNSRDYVCVILQNRISLDKAISIYSISNRRTPSVHALPTSVQCIQHAAYMSDELHLIAMVSSSVEKTVTPSFASIQVLSNEKGSGDYFSFPVTRMSKSKEQLKIKRIQFIPRLRLLSILYEDSLVHIWKVDSPELRFRVTFPQTFDCLSYSPDGCYFLLAQTIDSKQLNISAYRMCTVPGDRQVDETCRLSSINVCASLDCLLSDCYFLATAVTKDEIRISFVGPKTTVFQHCNFPLDQRKIDTKLVTGDERKISKTPLEAFQTALRDCFRVFPTTTPCDSKDLTFSEKLVVVRQDNEDLSDLSVLLRKWLGSQIVSAVKEQGKSVRKLKFVKNVFVKSMKNLNTQEYSRKSIFGTLIIELICLLPVQIVRANESHVLPINSGLKVMTLERLSRVLNRSNLCDGMDFGPIESVIEHYGGRVKVISNIGRSSTGKSYLGNHLFGSLFEVAATKCTNGVWMSCHCMSTCRCNNCMEISEDCRRPTLLVAFDVEGFDSIDRVLRGDTLLSQLIFSLSSVIFLNMSGKALDRGIQKMLKNFASGVSAICTASMDRPEGHQLSENTSLKYGNFIYGDIALFEGTFVPLLKDIQADEIDSLSFQIHDEMIETKNRTPQLKILFKKTASAVLRTFQTQQYYKDVEQLYLHVVEPSLCLFQNGAWFLRKVRAVVRQLMTNENRSLQDYFVDTTKQHVTEAIEDALVRGRFSSFAGEIEISDDSRISTKPFVVDVTLRKPTSIGKKYFLVGYWKGQAVFACKGFCNFVTRLCLDSEKGELSVERDASNVPLSHVVVSSTGEIDPKFASANEFNLIERDDFFVLEDTYDGAQKFLLQVLDMFRKGSERTESNEKNEWQPNFVDFILEIVERRCNRVKLWLEVLAKEVHVEKEAFTRIMPPAVHHRYKNFSEWFRICGAACGVQNCRFTCLLPCTHAVGERNRHNCLNKVHLCQKDCVYGCKGEDGEKARCTKGAGHHAISGDVEHKCSSENHQCLQKCRLLKNGCKERCNKSAKHDGVHDCGNRHNCPNKCNVLFCPAECKFGIDCQHSLCLCSEPRCNYLCELPGCLNFCVQVHGHVSDNSRPHLCGHTHECPALCQHVGVCERMNRSDETLILFTHVSSESQEIVEASKEYCIQTSKVAKCSNVITVSSFSHEKQHSCRGDHTCQAKCPLCRKLCTKSVNETGSHRGRHGIQNGHGLMLHSYLAGNSNQNPIKSSDNGTKYAISDFLYKETCAEVCLIDAFGGRGHSHVCNIDDDPNLNSLQYRPLETELIPDDGYQKGLCSHEDFWIRMEFDDPCRNEEFNMCRARCGICESSYCTRKLGHIDENEHNQSSACLNERCFVSSDGHHFECNHTPNFHIVFVFDTSASMTTSDFQPPSDIRVHETCQNRFGAVLWCALEMLRSHQWIANRCQVTMVTFSSEGLAIFKRKSLYEADKTFSDILQNGTNIPSSQSFLSSLMIANADSVSNDKDITLEGNTSFAEGLKEAKSAIEENLKSDETPVIAFFSDGHNNASDNSDIETQIRKIGNLNCKPPRMYLVYSETKAVDLLLKMKNWLEEEFVGQRSSCKVECCPCGRTWNGLRDQFMKIAQDCAQSQFVVPLIDGYNQQVEWLCIQEQSDTDRLQSRPARLVLSSSVYFKLLVFLRPIWSRYAKQTSHKDHGRERQDTSVLLYGSSHDCLNEIMKDLASSHGFYVDKTDLNGLSGAEQRDEIRNAFKRGRSAASGSSVLLLFSQLDLAFYNWDGYNADNGEPEFLLQLALLKLQPPRNVDLCVCCTSSNPWVISNPVLSSFSLLVEISHPTGKEIGKIVNCCFSSGIQETRNRIQHKLMGSSLTSVYKCLKEIGGNVDVLLQDDFILERAEENRRTDFVPEHLCNRIKTKQQALRYFDGKRRLLEMSRYPQHCGILVESDIFRYYSAKLPREQILSTLIGDHQYKSIEVHCRQNGSPGNVSCVVIVGPNDALSHWISSFIAHKVAGWYTWIAANTLKFCSLQQIFFQSLLDTTNNSVVIYAESLDTASKSNLEFLHRLIDNLLKRKKRLQMVVSVSKNMENEARKIIKNSGWSLDATIRHDLFVPLNAERTRQCLNLLLDINYSNWSSMSDQHLSWIASMTKEKSFEEVFNILNMAFDRTLVDYVDCTHVQAVAVTYNEPKPPMNGHYFIASTSKAICAVPLTENISRQAEFKLTPRRLAVEDVALVLKLPYRFTHEKLAKTERSCVEEIEKRIIKISCDHAVVFAERHVGSAENESTNKYCKSMAEEFVVADSDSEAASMEISDMDNCNPTVADQTAVRDEHPSGLQELSELHDVVSEASEEDSADTDNLAAGFSEMTAFFCSPGKADPPCTLANGEYKLSPVFYFGKFRKSDRFERLRVSVTLPDGFSRVHSNVCLWHSSTNEYQLPNWKKVICRWTSAEKRNISFKTKDLFGLWALTKCQSGLCNTISGDFVACLYAAECPKEGTGWKFRVYVLPNEKLQVCDMLNVK